MATLQFLRRSIGEITGDLDILTATANGSTTQFIDTLNGHVEKGSWKERQGFFSSGTAANLARTVRVSDNDKTTFTVTFTPAVPSATQTSDVLELHNKDDQGPTVAQIHSAINRCIEYVGRGVLTEVLDTAVTFDIDDPLLTIPASWRRLMAIEFRDGDETTDDWIAIPEADWAPTVDRVNYTVRVDNVSRWLADDMQIRLRGYTAGTALSADADSTNVDAEWLINAASAQLLLRLATSERVDPRRAADFRATAQYYQTQANAFRSKVPSSVRGATGVVLGGQG